MDIDSERTAKAWAACRDWITTFDGSVTQAELEDAPLPALAPGLEQLSDHVANLRILPIWRDEIKNPPVDLPNEGLITRLSAGEVLALTVNYDILPEEAPVEMHLSVFMDAPGTAGISVSWWADQVFPDEEDPIQRFDSLFTHLEELQKAFSANRLFIGPEAPDRPGDEGSLWIEV